jgi:hypothetical protein
MAPPRSTGDAKAALARLRALAGDWTVAELSDPQDGLTMGRPGAPVNDPAIFESVAGGTVVMQRSDFLVLWYLDNEAIMASLFAYGGYQARLRSSMVRRQPDGEMRIDLEVIDSSNVGPNTVAPRRMLISIGPDDHVIQKWIYYNKRGRELTSNIYLSRAR